MDVATELTRAMTGPEPLNAHTVVVGLGATGLSCARHLTRHAVDFAVIDTRDAPPALDQFARDFPRVAVRTGAAGADALGQVTQLLLSPGVPREHPLVVDAIARGIEVIGDIELFARHADAPVVAVTGSNGKSTVVSMVAAILAEAGLDARTGGNIGTPALDLLSGAAPDCYVLELSSFQLESTTTLAPRAAAVLNVSPDHMDRYRSFADYLAAKLRIGAHAETLVINLDDASLAATTFAVPLVTISSRDAAEADYTIDVRDGTAWLCASGDPVMPAGELAIGGTHNLPNALAAIALCDVLSVPRTAARAALAVFAGLPHRCATVATADGIEWIDDSKGTNVGASSAAIAGVFEHRSGVLIAGGQGKGADFVPLADVLRGRVHDVVLIGEDAPVIARALESVLPVHFALDMRAAVTAARALARPGEAVLLSPACASFDMFDGFAARGVAFASAVAEVTGA